MHEFDLDPATGYAAPGIQHDPDLDDEEPEDGPVRAREGLPPAFRMRHTPHYVEQLMGEGPLQTVRQIPVAEIHADPTEVELAPGLVTSIREIGLVQPLLVAADGPRRFELLAGVHRLAAAREAGLVSVPCLVQTADASARAKIRHAASQHRPAPKAPAPVPAPGDDAGVLVAAFAEIADTLSFVNGLAPFASGQESGFRSRVLNDLMRLETQRATVLASAASMLMRRDASAGEAVDCAAIAEALRPRIELEARYRGAVLEWSGPVPRAIADADGLGTAWACILHALLTLARPGSRLHVTARVPRVRPALIVEATLTEGVAIGSADQLVDAEWAEHPGGRGCTLMLAAAAHCARMHHGRLGLSVTEQGLTVSLVVPQPLHHGWARMDTDHG